MTDEVTNDNVEQTTAAEPSPNEVEARAAGWVPQDEYHGDPNKWVDADEFVRRGPLFEKINNTTRELKEVRKTLEQLKAHHAKVKEISYKEALATLRKEKRDAFVEGDPDKIVEIDDRIEELKEEKRQFDQEQAREIQAAVQQEIHPEFKAWTDRNTWYNQSRPMRAFADALGIELRATGLAPSEVLKRVEAQVKAEFPNKFRNANRDKAHAVEGVGGKGGRQNSGESGMSAEDRRVMEKFVRSGIMDKAQYIAEWKKVNGVD
jgi:DNA repair exonuclease SbcCD ATPase subunit